MREPATQIAYATIVTTLQQLCADKRSGAFIITGAQSARVHLIKGEIVALLMQHKKGLEAVPSLVHVQASRIDFIPNLPCSLHTPLPDTSMLLEMLAAQASIPPTAASAVPNTVSARRLDMATQTLLSETLAQYIGPVALVVCKKMLDAPQDIEQALQALASNIPEAAQAQRFVTEMRTKLAAHI